MHQWKYVMFSNNNFVIFNDVQPHNSFQYHGTIVGAGFISFGVNSEGNVEVSCFGKSTSLGIESREEVDSDIINKSMRGY